MRACDFGTQVPEHPGNNYQRTEEDENVQLLAIKCPADHGDERDTHDLEWTRGNPRRFASSNKVRRGFCAECGTPLTFETGGPIEIAVGAFDDPNVVRPTMQLNPADKVAFFDGICVLPMRPDGAEPQAEAFKASVVTFQHPDHDIAKWPAGDR